jgi:hypothetical protein
MERINPLTNGDDSANWADNTNSNGAVGRNGSLINGTPGSENSVYSGSTQNGLEVSLENPGSNPVEGETFTLNINLTNGTDIFSYGFDILYDESVLEYISASEGSFLNENGNVSTSFESGLENGNQGKIVIAGSRLVSPVNGISGSGDLLSITFKALQSSSIQITFDSNSFVSDVSGDVNTTFNPLNLTIDPLTVDAPTNFVITEDANRYEISLNWDASASGADFYKILRKDQNGTFIELGTTTDTNFVDSNNIIPTYIYEYQVIAVKGSIESNPVSGQGSDNRGIKGDNNRSDRVDGRDLDNLSRHYTLTLNDPEFDPLIDTTYDGIIDGSDLIDIGANWAVTY